METLKIGPKNLKSVVRDILSGQKICSAISSIKISNSSCYTKNIKFLKLVLDAYISYN